MCSVRAEPGLRNALNEQATMIQDALDVANIQDDIVREIKNDPRMTAAKQADLLKVLDGKILPLTTVCLKIFCANKSCLMNLRIPLVISRYVLRYSRPLISDKPPRLHNVGNQLSRKVFILLSTH